MDTYLPPKYSLNSFFVRHVAHPRRMKYISGLGNAKICSVNDVGFITTHHSNSPIQGGGGSRTNRFVEFPPNNFNEELLRSESNLLFKRKERAVPPTGIWNTYGLIDNTEKWRDQLNTLASSVGLLTQADLEEMRRKKDREDMIRNYQFRPPAVPKLLPTSSSQQSQRAHSAAIHKNTNSSSSTRLNEPLPSRNRTSRQSRGGSAHTGHAQHKSSSNNNKHYVIDSAEREIWMLQVLCQILQTDNLTDVQSWLVSTSDSEKERVKQLIDQAMRGLEESGRVNEQNNNNNNISNSIDYTTKTPKSNHYTNNSNNNNINDEKNESINQSSINKIEHALKKIDLTKKPQLANKTNKTKYNNNNNKVNVLKLDNINDGLETIHEPTSSNDYDENC